MQLTHSTAIVTGGCSGLGLATATHLRSLGFRVALFDINREAGEQHVANLGSADTLFCHVNVCDEDSVKKGIQHTVEHFGDIYACINCAGVVAVDRTLDKEGKAAPLANFQRTVDINLVGTFNVARLAAEQIASQQPIDDDNQRGVIINTASIAGYEGQIGQTAYAASKAGIIGLTLPMARDLAPLGIRVNTIAPGVMGTPLLLAMPEKVQAGLVSHVQNPKRLGLPEEFGKLAAHIIANTYLNGETIRLDGALRMTPK